MTWMLRRLSSFRGIKPWLARLALLLLVLILSTQLIGQVDEPPWPVQPTTPGLSYLQEQVPHALTLEQCACLGR